MYPFRGNWELPGRGIRETDAEEVSYDYLLEELQREVQKRVGIDIPVNPMSAMYPVFLKGQSGYDLAMVAPVVKKMRVGNKENERIFVSTKELNRLAMEFAPADKKDGKGLLSGWGKRMHRMALKALSFSPHMVYAVEAKKTLEEIQTV